MDLARRCIGPGTALSKRLREDAPAEAVRVTVCLDAYVIPESAQGVQVVNIRPKQQPDPLKHFHGDGPGWKLAALFVWRLPHILYASGVLASAVLGYVVWRGFP